MRPFSTPCCDATAAGSRISCGPTFGTSAPRWSARDLPKQRSPRRFRPSERVACHPHDGRIIWRREPNESCMSRDAAIARAADYFDSGGFKADLARRVAIPTESQNPERAAQLARYVETEIKPALEPLGFGCPVPPHPKPRGPPPAAGRPTLFLGTPGGHPIDLWVDARGGGHHSGNWGGLLSSPAIQLVHALSSTAGPTGQVRIPEWVPDRIPEPVRRALADCEVRAGPGDPVIDPNWGEPGLTLAEKVFAWCCFEILAMTAGNPESPVNAVPPRAWARGQLRFVVGIEIENILPALRRHLDRHGFPMVQIAQGRDEIFHATRLDPDHPWVQWVAGSIARTTNRPTAILPNSGGSLPNDIFSEGLGLPTISGPHSYLGCSQHAPNEHLPVEIAREGLRLMAGENWDLGEVGGPGTLAATGN